MVMVKEEKSQLGITVKKSEDFSEWYTQVITKAELIEYGPVSGCMVIRPYAYSIWESAQEFFNAEIRKLGVKNAYFPMLIPESFLKKEQDHVEGFTPEVAWVTMAGNTPLQEKLAIRPTSETIMYDSYAKWIRSHKDLPLKLNQWCNIVRWEFKHPTPFLRTREFLWQEGHTVFSNAKDAEQEVLDIVLIYAKLFEELYAVPVLVGKKSEGEKFAGANYTDSIEALLPNGRAVQSGTSHFLGQNFSKAFGISFLNEKGEREYGYQNSWGFSTRSLGVLFGVHGDDKGLVLPPRVAPTQVVIVPILFSTKPELNEKVMALASKVKDELSELRVLFDDDADSSPGYKFNYWELKGVPLRIEIGPKDVDNKSVVFVRRDTGEKKSVQVHDVRAIAKSTLEYIQANLLSNAKKFLDDHIVKAKSTDDLKRAVDDGMFAFVPWCGSKECEARVKEECGAKSLNIPFSQPENKGDCFCCGEKAEVLVYFGKSY
jgi:prolyl-tRNA synthetase family I